MAYIDTVGDVVRVTMGFGYPTGQVQEPSFHLRCTATGGADSRPLINSQIDSLVVAHLIPHLDPQASYKGSKVSMALSAFKNQPTLTVSNVPGTSTSVSLPTQVRGLVKFTTEFVGKEFRGRIYMPTPCQADMGADLHPTLQVRGKWFTVMDTFRAGTLVGGSNWQLVLFHRRIAGPPVIPASATPIIKVADQPKWATQRKGGDYGRLNVSPPW